MRIAIAGAGIAGLTAAIALARSGFSVELHERAARLEEIGAGIQLSPNAMAVLERLGVAARLSGAVVPQAIEVRDGLSGRRLTRIPLGETVRARYGALYCLIHRADLQAALLAAAGQDSRIVIHLGSEVRQAALCQDGVTFSAGGRAGSADLLIAADGVHSRIRLETLGQPAAAFAGRRAWRVTLPTAQAPASVDLGSTGLWLGPGAHLVHYPLRGGRELNIVAIGGGPEADRPPEASFGPPLRPLLDAVSAWTSWPLHVAESSLAWTSGRVVLIGDAAHAMLPTAAQGGAQAIEDAWVLAACLAASPDRPQRALADYQRARGPRVDRIAREARRNLAIYNLRGPAALVRNAAMRGLPPKMHLARLDWLFGWDPDLKP